MKNQFFSFIIICSLYVTGCLGGTSGKMIAGKKPVPEKPVSASAAAPQTIADLHLSLAKPLYSPNEPIPLEMTIQMGKFDLLVPYATLEGKGAFTKLVVKNIGGGIVPPKQPITFAGKTKTLLRKGKEVACTQGIELKAGTVKNVKLEDLRTYYQLKPGEYTLQVLMEVKVYKEFLADQSQQVLELEREIALIQADPKLPPDAKQEAISSLQEDIKLIQSQAESESDEIYLPVDSLRGSADLQSNVVALTIQ